MSSFLQQLENNEAVLLMYLFDELPAEDRAEVEQMLATDAGLRAQLERLREAHLKIDPAMRKLDAATRLPVPEAVATRQMSRVIQQWTVEQFAGRQTEEAPVRRRKLAAWIGYPAGAVAAALVIGLLWWGLTDQGTSTTGGTGPIAFPTDEGHESLIESITGDAFVRDVVRDPDLQRVESQMAALWQATTDDPMIVPIVDVEEQ